MECLWGGVLQKIQVGRVDIYDNGGIYDMGKSETEYYDIMRSYEKIISQHFSDRTTLNLGTEDYYKGKESENTLLMSDCTCFFTDTGGINPRLTEEELYMMAVDVTWKKTVAFTYKYL